MAEGEKTAQPTPAERIRAEAKEATRRALLEAGLLETVDQGGTIPSIDAIVARAGYTRGAFYFYFEDRDHFVTEMLEWVLNDILQQLFVATTEGGADLREVVTRFTDALAEGEWPDVGGDLRSAYLAVLQELRPGTGLREQHATFMRQIVTMLEALVRDGQEAGTFRKDVDPGDVATVILLTAIGGIVWDRIDIDVDVRASGQALLALIERPGA